MPLFGTVHGLALIVITIIAGICIREGKRGLVWPRAMLAFICLSVFPINQLALIGVDFEPAIERFIPFHLCDIAAVTAGFGILTRNPLLCELTYCWGLAGTMQALITPNLTLDFQHPFFWSFFIQHGAIVIVALYLPLAMKWKPRNGVVLRMFFWNQIYFFAALTMNWALGTNFGFLARKPKTATLLDHLGDWPTYLFWLQLLAILLIILLFLPFRRSINIWRWNRIGVSPHHE
ncbi:MAG: TIGR02206 family membrane protein [Akkermansiaceae bacterium]|nr:TIGR02206 family membrane protein [Akkermansiaceae bacterium]